MTLIKFILQNEAVAFRAYLVLQAILLISHCIKVTSIVPVLSAENVKCLFLGQFVSDFIQRGFGI